MKHIITPRGIYLNYVRDYVRYPTYIQYTMMTLCYGIYDIIDSDKVFALLST